GDPRNLRPLITDDGPLLWPIDRDTIALVWSESGYPGKSPYRNSHRLTTHRHHAWRNDGAPYEPAAARVPAAPTPGPPFTRRRPVSRRPPTPAISCRACALAWPTAACAWSRSTPSCS